MGEMADFTLEQIDWDIEWVGPRIRSTGYGYSVPRRPICKYCRKKKLLWRQVKGKWVLFENKRKPHICKMHTLPFETLKALAELVKTENDRDKRSRRAKG